MIQFRDYQKKIIAQGTKVLQENSILYLSMEVRTGKTLTALGICEQMKVANVLFITKKKAIGSIQKDYELFNPGFKLYVINFESLHKLKHNDYDLYIVDEAHSLGAFPKPSNRTKIIKQYVQDRFLIMLSGTPTPESWSQIYHQFWISENSPFKEGSFYKWAHEYIEVRKIYVAHGNQVNDYSRANIIKIQEVIKPYMISYTQQQAGFSTEVVEEILKVKMLPSTYALVKILERNLVFTGKNGGVILAETPVKLMSKVHQIYSGTVKLEDGTAKILDTSKADFIKSFFEGKKIAIFYKFKAELKLLQDVFKEDLCTTLEEFNSTPKNIALQIVSGREGISLSVAKYLVMYNIDFSATSYWQGRDRLTTKERSKNKVYWIFSNGGLEDRIYKTVMGKKSFTTKHYKPETQKL
jgi:hypothetical protein